MYKYYGGRYEIRTHDCFLDNASLAKRCNKPDSANLPGKRVMKTACVRSHFNDKPPMPTNASLDLVEESVGFEPTEHFCPTVFKTVALIQALPTLHVTAQLRAVHCKP